MPVSSVTMLVETLYTYISTSEEVFLLPSKQKRPSVALTQYRPKNTSLETMNECSVISVILNDE